MYWIFSQWPAFAAWLPSSIVLSGANAAPALSLPAATAPSPAPSALVRETLDENPGVQAARVGDSLAFGRATR